MCDRFYYCKYCWWFGAVIIVITITTATVADKTHVCVCVGFECHIDMFADLLLLFLWPTINDGIIEIYSHQMLICRHSFRQLNI